MESQSLIGSPDYLYADYKTMLAIAEAESIAEYTAQIERHATKQFDRAEEYIQTDLKMESLDDSEQTLTSRIERRETCSEWLRVCHSMEASEFGLVDEAMVIISLVVLEYIYPQLSRKILMKKIEFKIITSSMLFLVYPEDAELRIEYREVMHYIRHSMDDVHMESQTALEKVDYYNSLFVSYQQSRLDHPTSPRSPKEQHTSTFSPY